MKNPIWREIVAGLNAEGLDYVLVGAAALIVHGLPRATIDVDVHVLARADILTRVFRVAEGLGLKSDQRDILGLLARPDLFQDQWICFSHDGDDILDVFLAGEKQFRKLASDAVWRIDGDLKIRVASLAAIEAMKMNSDRPTDKADVELIREARKYEGR